jgi:hypothetical protein
MDYMDLLIRKRMAVAAWRARRDQQRGKACAQAALYENPSAEEAVAEHVATSRQRTEKEREHAVAKELVQNWKVSNILQHACTCGCSTADSQA